MPATFPKAACVPNICFLRILSKEETFMEGRMYPPTGRFKELTPAERATRLEVAADLLNILQFWRGDPRLNPWEEGFLTSLIPSFRHSQG
jgi:hypothetical protein